MSTNNPTYTISIAQIGNSLQVHIPELDITVWTAPGKLSRDDALDVAHAAIEQYHAQQERIKAQQAVAQS
jgi:hypothetical protein